LKTKFLSFLFILICLAIVSFSFLEENQEDDRFISHEVNLKKSDLRMFLNDEEGKKYGNFDKLKNDLNSKGYELIFAMNGGMYMENQNPLGLYIEEGITKRKINLVQEAYGNFYLQPNGVFYITNNKEAGIIQSTKFQNKAIRFASQSGPMLLVDGEVHNALNEGSKNLNVRNAVGILPNGNVLFAMSKKPINFYDFAMYFKKLGCKNALYLDGFVSKTYLPSKNWKQDSGKFGVIIAEIQKAD